jgi:hypothetical protein
MSTIITNENPNQIQLYIETHFLRLNDEQQKGISLSDFYDETPN